MSHVMQNDGGSAGVFLQEGRIIGAKSVSNEDIYKNGKPVDVGIELTLDIGKEFNPQFSIAGNFKLDQATGKVSDSSATKIKIFLNNMKVKWTKLNPDNSIPDDVLAQLIGTSIVYLRYSYKIGDDGKAKFRTFDYILPAGVEDARTKVRAKFNEAVEKGYAKLVDESTSFPPPAGGAGDQLPPEDDNI